MFQVASNPDHFNHLGVYVDLNNFILYNSVTTISVNGNLRAVCTNLGHLYAYFKGGMAIFVLLQQNAMFSAMKFFTSFVQQMANRTLKLNDKQHQIPGGDS